MKFGWISTLPMVTRVFSPYQLNPFDFNPLRDVLERVIDFDLRARPTPLGSAFLLDVGEILARSPGRFPMAHIKDMNTAGDMVDVGAGEIDFVTLLGSPAGTKVTHLFVEHDNPADPWAFAKQSHDHLSRLEY